LVEWLNWLKNRNASFFLRLKP